MCPHTATDVSSYCNRCVLMLLYCVLMLLQMGPQLMYMCLNVLILTVHAFIQSFNQTAHVHSIMQTYKERENYLEK